MARRTIRTILPPYILQSIAQNGAMDQRRSALATLATDHTLRAIRAGHAMRTSVAPLPQATLLTVEGLKQRLIFTANNTQTLPGIPVRSEGEPPTGDIAADEAFDNLGSTFDFYWEVYARNSIDDEGMPLNGTVHFGEDYNNAFWDGQRMVFGDGDGELFNRLTLALDIIGHELTHGVIEQEAQLIYFFQAGALNESIADVFGALIRQWKLNQTVDQADWLIGKGLFTENVEGVGLRSMQAPGTAYDDPILGKDPQPAHMRDFVRTFQDNGGVHINSGIPNHAFYHVAKNLGGFAWEKAGRIWYEALRDPSLRPNTGFRGFARRTIVQAGRIYNEGAAEQQAVREGWRQVGIDIV